MLRSSLCNHEDTIHSIILAAAAEYCCIGFIIQVGRSNLLHTAVRPCCDEHRLSYVRAPYVVMYELVADCRLNVAQSLSEA